MWEATAIISMKATMAPRKADSTIGNPEAAAPAIMVAIAAPVPAPALTPIM